SGLEEEAIMNSGGSMAGFGKKAFVAQAWLTAVLMLTTGIPHFDCRCPNGQVKRFCLGFVSGTSPCCCSGSCCSPVQDGKCCCQTRCTPRAKQTSCCVQHQARRAQGQPPGAGYSTQPSGCVKTLIAAEHRSLTPAKPLASED